MYQYMEISRDQYIMEDQYVPVDEKYATEIKLENDIMESSYYPMGINLPSMNFSTTKDSYRNTHVTQFFNFTEASTPSLMTSSTSYFVPGGNFESSDGECSPKSLDEKDLLESMLGVGGNDTPSSCVKGIKTITKNPTRQKNSNGRRKSSGERKCGKIRNNRSSTSSRKSADISNSDTSSMPKEKDRARLFNEAFDGLRKRIPSIPASKKLSKIEILRLAICYMSYLKFRLEDAPSLHQQHNENIDKNVTSGNIEMTNKQISLLEEQVENNLTDANNNSSQGKYIHLHIHGV